VEVPEEEKQASRVLGSMLFFVVVTQYVLYVWKKRGERSFQYFTLLGLWLIPFFFALRFGLTRFLIGWLAYSLQTSYFIRLSTQRPLSTKAPARVYRWFLRMHQATNMCVIGGYVLVFADVLNLPPFYFFPTSPHPSSAASWILLELRQLSALGVTLGLYFGVLTRDIAEICTWQLSSALGLAKRSDEEMNDWQRQNLCALCGLDLFPAQASAIALRSRNHPLGRQQPPSSPEGATAAVQEPLFELQCGHTFHESCLRGWAIVGKNTACPYCGDPVRLSQLLGRSPWQKQSLIWIHLLDAVRYLIVWHPLVLVLANIFVRLLLPQDYTALMLLTHHRPDYDAGGGDTESHIS